MRIPLAERVRPRSLQEYIGQNHLVGPEGSLTPYLKQGYLPSMILWGPPGTGKTTLASLLCHSTERNFQTLSAINSGVKEVREAIDKAKKSGGLFTTKNPVLFIDEIHRFSKSQQDSLLGAVEQGIITLIGATTENPSFEIIPALLSRCQVYILEPLKKEDLLRIIEKALEKDVELSNEKIEIREVDKLLLLSGGDARKFLNSFEILAHSVPERPLIITNQLVDSLLKNNTMFYDKTGDQHYDVVSAFIKSIRGSDPNAAVYWLARMIAGGEDVKFIARRMLILASEDIGNANPTALVIANNTFQSVSIIGYPESRIILSQCAIYLACSPKSNSCYLAIGEAQKMVEKTGALTVPLHLRNAPTKLSKNLGYGQDYMYTHNFENNFSNQEYLPSELSGIKFYNPSNNSREAELRRFLKSRWRDKYDY